MTTTAGQRLRAKFEAALERASREQGRARVWTEAEEVALTKACESADQGERVKRLLDVELARPESAAAFGDEVVVGVAAAEQGADGLCVAAQSCSGPGEVAAAPARRAAQSFTAAVPRRVMPRVALVELVRTATLYQWLIDREARALAAGGTLPWSSEQPSYTGSEARLEAMGRGEPVDIPASALPPYVRPAQACRQRSLRAVVDADGGVELYRDSGAAWLADAGP